MKELNAVVKDLYSFLDEKQAEDVIVYDVDGKNPETDYIVLSTARNNRHLSALSRDADDFLTKAGYELRGREGDPESGWILMDFNDLVLHLFVEEQRSYYHLERLCNSYSVLLQS